MSRFPLFSPQHRLSRLSRRRFLGLLPWTAAALACGDRDTGSATEGKGIPPHLEGRIVGASRRHGHRLRDGDLPAEPGEREEVGVVIVGGGIAGLSAGWRLMNRGFGDFVVLELEDRPGGNSSSGASEVSAYPWGAHYLPQPTTESTAVRELLIEMGLARPGEGDRLEIDHRHLCHDPQERLFLWGGWQEGLVPQVGLHPGDGEQILAFVTEMERWRSWRGSDGRKAFAIPLAESSRDAEPRSLDQFSMAEYLDQKGWTCEPLRWWVDYCCRDDYGAHPEEVSAWAGVHYFASRPEGDPEVFTWPEGNGRLVRHLVERLAGRVRTGQMVYRVTTRSQNDDEGVEVDVLDLATQTPRRLRARRVIYALPRFTAPYVLRGALPAAESPFEYSPWVVANLHLDHLPSERNGSIPAHSTWDNVDTRSDSLGYVVATHQALRSRVGATVLTWYRPLCQTDPVSARREMEQRAWESWAAEVLDDLARVHPRIRQETRRLDVMLWGHAMVRPTPGLIWGDARRRAAEPHGPIVFAHSDLSGLSIFEEAQYWGVRAAERVLEVLV